MLTFMVKSNTRFRSRPWPRVLALISTSSGFSIQGELFSFKLRSKSDTRSFDCAVPTSTTFWPSCLKERRKTPSGTCFTNSSNRYTG